MKKSQTEIMKQKIKILHLEDVPFDAELVARELKKGKINSDILIVDTKAEFEQALKTFSPDIILSDHSLASFDSHEALRLVKQAGITVPFILVTAAMTDEFAAKIMKDGAYDYILKDRLRRLPSAVINSIEKQRLKDLQQTDHERLVFHIENTPLGFIEWDTHLHIKSLSKRAEEIFGWSREDFLENRSGYSRVYEEDLPIVIKAVKDLVTGVVERNTTQHRNITKDGRVIWCEWFNSVSRDKEGKAVTIMSLVQDITVGKTFSERLKYNDTRLKEAQAIAHIGNWEIDIVNNTEVWSDEIYKILGADETLTLSTELFLSFIHPDDLNHVKNAFKSFKNTSLDYRLLHKNGVVKYVYSTWGVECDKNENPIRIYGILQDITEQKLAEIERTKMVNDLIQRNKDLEQFSYIISHNLRAPVANIIGASNALSDLELTEEDKEILNRGINESVIRLDVVVKDLNHILQVKTEINENKEVVAFSELIDDIKISIKNLIDKESIEISYNFSGINEFLTLKPYLYSIFFNLITNSVKYRQQQIPSIIKIRSSQKKNKIELIFTDNGMGIDLQKRGDQVFGLYKRFHTNIEGKGMGLFMVKAQVEALGGKISIKSAENKGTEFKIEFEL
jgi:PAS domain S-box-containing protein